MHLVRSLQKRIIEFCFARLIQDVRNHKRRPFYIDEEGVWFKTKYDFSVYSNLKDRILELDVNAVWEEMESSFILNNLKERRCFRRRRSEYRIFFYVGCSTKSKQGISYRACA